ncbi:DciA family protein [Candidatus Nitrosacidococcus sp. I8]|uniref:DciA family protein n=1 Tax=Candidatus Nitrosacidococcus sp. I8 TaxID=2942908 RepID=UPI002225BC31|nr:DciA family protein [Candidatus Nitrosacidococcus sp. I8]CAH9019307.1 hypothetical protein NURINAE_01462 [Candidatus Nitrosacidococcus sp. I8]
MKKIIANASIQTTSNPQSVNKLIRCAQGNLQYIFYRSRFLQELSLRVNKSLPKELGTYCLVGNIRGNFLILYTDSDSRASLLRYYVPTIIRDIQQYLKTTLSYKVKIRIQPLLFDQTNSYCS